MSSIVILVLTVTFTLLTNAMITSTVLAVGCDEDRLTDCGDKTGLHYFYANGVKIYTNNPSIVTFCNNDPTWNYYGFVQKYIWYQTYPTCGTYGPWLIQHSGSQYTIVDYYPVGYYLLVNFGGSVIGVEANLTGGCKKVAR